MIKLGKRKQSPINIVSNKAFSSPVAGLVVGGLSL